MMRVPSLGTFLAQHLSQIARQLAHLDPTGLARQSGFQLRCPRKIPIAKRG